MGRGSLFYRSIRLDDEPDELKNVPLEIHRVVLFKDIAVINYSCNGNDGYY